MANHASVRKQLKQTICTAVMAMVLVISWIAVAPPSSAAGDRPNTRGSATTASPQGRMLSDTIGSATDQDWYRFKTTSTRTIRVVLGSLSADYTMQLRTGKGALILQRSRTGVQVEEIIKRLPAGTYFVQVSSATGEVSPSPYTLRFDAFGASVRVLSQRTYATDTTRYIVGEVLNGTAGPQQFIQIVATFYNAAGRVVGTDFTYTSRSIVGAGQKSPFLLVDVPTAHHYKLTVDGRASTRGPVGKMALVTGVPTIEEDGYSHFVGEVTNKNSTKVDFVEVIGTIYDSVGRVLWTDFTFTNPSSLAPGQTAPFDLTFPDVTGLNRIDYVVD